jgi:hypothetical protein
MTGWELVARHSSCTARIKKHNSACICQIDGACGCNYPSRREDLHAWLFRAAAISLWQQVPWFT